MIKKANEDKMRRLHSNRPKFPKRAVVTAGMPYGNKELHFGHVGGLFVHADTYARFLKDRIGKDQVIFVSGTDCYGSPIEASYKREVDRGYRGTMKDYVLKNHDHQKNTLDNYKIEPDLYATSAFGRAGEIHEALSHEIIENLEARGLLVEMVRPQFYDATEEKFLNGRQVTGKCPVQGCRSQKAYADECDMGHQFMPSELIDPVSLLSGDVPELRNTANLYFKLDEYKTLLADRIKYLRDERSTRAYILSEVEEFLKAPVLYVKASDYRTETFVSDILPNLPAYTLEGSGGKSSVALVFESLSDREKACDVLGNASIRYRTGKALVPFRLTGNCEWGIRVPNRNALTFWVWPESLWAPISFTKAFLESKGEDPLAYKKWWKDPEAEIYQFIGEDNIYFYAIAEMGLFLALDDHMPGDVPNWDLIKLPNIIANKHILYMDKKASSSGDVKPPMAHDLLEHYTADQLRIHFLSLGLARKSVSFSPQAFVSGHEADGMDPVLKDGNLLTNVFNRLARSCFYTAQKYTEGKIPNIAVSEDIRMESERTVLEYERFMHDHELHRVIYLLDEYMRKMNKHWAKCMRLADAHEDGDLRIQTLADGFHALRTAVALFHPIAPRGCEEIASYLNLDICLWDWNLILKPLPDLVNLKAHSIVYLEPKHDFFAKHASQLSK